MSLKYPTLKPGDPLVIQNADYFCTQPRYVGRTVEFVRYATAEELARGAGPYIILLPNGNNFAALETEIAPEAPDEGGIVLDATEW